MSATSMFGHFMESMRKRMKEVIPGQERNKLHDASLQQIRIEGELYDIVVTIKGRHCHQNQPTYKCDPHT